MGRLSRFTIEIDVAHDGGEAAAEELLAIATARAERAIRDEGAEPMGGTREARPLGHDAKPD